MSHGFIIRKCPRAHHAAVDGEGEHEAVVVVDVLADQVDPAGRFSDSLRSAAELLAERGDDGFDALFVRLRAIDELARHDGGAARERASASRNSCAFSSGAVSLMKVPAPVSIPARYLSLSFVRWGGMNSMCRCS